MAWLLGLVAELEADPAIRRQLRLIANPSALVRGDRLFLSERAGPHTEGAGPIPVSLRATARVKRALELARQPVAYDELQTELQGIAHQTREETQHLIDELLRHTVLTTDLRPPLTCLSPAEYVIARLADIPTARATHRVVCF